MNNQSFWASYKAKCDEKGIAPLYADEEAFNKAMIEPPRPYSTDDLVPSKDNRIEDSNELEGMYSLMQQSHGFVEDEYLEDFEENAKETNVETVKPIVCVCCQEPKNPDAFGTLRNGELRKICKVCHGRSISKARNKNKAPKIVEETPIAHADHSAQVMARKELTNIMTSNSEDNKEVGKVAIMELRVFYSALAMAYERGVAEGKAFADLTIAEVDLPVILDEVLGASA